MVPRDQGKICDASLPARVVLHVDLDAFFVQVERSLNPTLRGRPMAVQQHADIIAVSYEARKLGVKKHMPTSFIRQRFPSVKLVHVQTIGQLNNKVSYRNYRQAAGAIFTLIRAFCPSEGENASLDDDASCSTARRKYSGKFQKASVDEAFLEPGRRTLEAELILAEQEKKGKKRLAPAPTSGANPLKGVKRRRSWTSKSPGNFRSSSSDVGSDRDENDGGATCNARETPGNRGGIRRGAQASACSSGDALPVQEERSRRECAEAGRMEVDQLLEAGGSLGMRIQRALREALEYDCSVGVAENKFLAKLATSTVKPKGVRVLFRQDVTSVLASTAPTKIPGCGRGTPAASHFAEWGADSVLDLRRLALNQLCERLGEQLGRKVYDRCRGVDNEPVEPNSEPSRVSSSMSLVPLIKPAQCLGMPNEKITPIFPWEVARLRACMVTLVDDLLDRMKETSERHRRPTKLCVEYHLHKRGSKSQTFCLPPSTAQVRKVRHGEGSGESSSDASPDPVLADHLPPPSALVELSLSPFRKFGRDASRDEAPIEGEHTSESPPVVKLIVSLLGFERAEGGTLTVSWQGQRSLLDMMRPGQKSIQATSRAHEEKQLPDHVDIETSVTSTPVESKAIAPESLAFTGCDTVMGEGEVHTPPEARPANSSVDVSRSSHEPAGKETALAPPGETLVRCPLCKACFPLGHEWDVHRKEHLILYQRGGSHGKPVTPQPASFPMQVTSYDNGRRSHPELDQRWLACPEDDSHRRQPEVELEIGTAGEKASEVSQIGTRVSWRTQSNEGICRLSSLLPLSVEATQAKEFLETRGLLEGDEQTRFAHVCIKNPAQDSEK